MSSEPLALKIDDPNPPLAARIAVPLAAFGRQSAAGGVVLLACAVVALVWANSGWHESYHALVHAPLGVSFRGVGFERPLEWWINDGLMALFFFLVGLEIKREFLIGELRNVRTAALPIIGAAGGMLAPALIFLAFNAGRPTARGWGVPTATDIAFSLGVLALLGSRVPHGLKVFLTTLAIADDLGALLVIAIFYTERLQWGCLGWAGLCLAVMVGFNAAGVRRWWLYLVPGVAMWWLVYQSGVHATIAGVLAAFAIPARSRIDSGAFLKYVRNSLVIVEMNVGGSVTTSDEQQRALQGIEDATNKVQTPMQAMEHALVPWVTFLILPLFALANAGVSLGGEGPSLGAALTSPETLGVALGLMLGKPLGITLASMLGVRLGLGVLPGGVNWKMLHGVAWVAGIGFTMSLFIANLAFPGTAGVLNDAKLGILCGSALAGVVGLAMLWVVAKPGAAEPSA